MPKKTQFELDFTPGLTEQFPDFMDCVRDSVYGCGRSFKVVAGELNHPKGWSSADLTRRLSNNPNDSVNFPLAEFPATITATGDLTPIYWLVEKFCEIPEAKKQRILQELDNLLTRLPTLIEQVKSDPNSNVSPFKPKDKK